MGLARIVRSAVAAADGVTTDLQVPVLRAARLAAKTSYGKPTFADAVSHQAIVDRRQRLVRTTTGEELLTQALVTFLTPTGVQEGDLITLPGGAIWEVLQVSGVLDSGTLAPFVEEAYLGINQGR